MRVTGRVCILGASLDVGNRGVMALGVSLARLFLQVVPGAEVVFHYGHKSGGWRQLSGFDDKVQVLNCRLSPRSAPSEHILTILFFALLYRLGVRGPARRNPWLRSLLTADFIGDITGGDSFSDIYGFRRFMTGSLPLLSVALLGCRYTMLPQTYGPFRSKASRAVARILLRGATRVLTRDKNSAQLVQELTGKLPEFCPDVAFTLEPKRPAHVQTIPTSIDLDEHDVIGVNISGLLYMGGYTGKNMFGLRSDYRQLIEQLVDALLIFTSAKILLVPHVFGPEEQEQEASEVLLNAVSSRYPGRVFMVRAELSERELKWIVGRTQFFIGSRMHACIGALSQGIPAVGLAYSDKFLGVFQAAGVGDAIVDLRQSDIVTVVARCLGAWNERQRLSEALESKMPAVRSAVTDTFRTIS